MLKHHSASVVVLSADLIEFVDVQNNHLEWVNEDRARDLLRARVARLIRRGGRARVLVARAAQPSIVPLDGGGHSGPTRYSHDHEVAETYVDDDGRLRRRHPLDANPRGVWTMRRIHKATHSIFTAVVDGCRAA